MGKSSGSTEQERQDANTLVWEEFKETTQHKGDGYHVELPWRKEVQDLPEIKAISFRRLEPTVERLRRNPELMQQYHDNFMKELQLDIIEVAHKEEVLETHLVHYLVHQAVLNQHKVTTKPKIVFDALDPVAQRCFTSKSDYLPDVIRYAPPLLHRTRCTQ